MDPFATLAALAREEHALVTDERFEELEALAARRERVLAALPAATPPHALPHLREAARLQALVSVALTGARDRVAAELSGVDRQRAGAQGYQDGAGAPVARPSFDATL